MMRLKTFAGLLLLTLLSGCYYFRNISIPLNTIEYKRQMVSRAHNRQLMVLLPGISDRPSVFDQSGFIAAIHKNNPHIDIVAVDAHLKYYQTRIVVERLRNDVIKPALAQGYKEIYLAGISLGGLGSLLYLKQYPNEISKIFILAPYLGDEQDYLYLLEGDVPAPTPADPNLWPWLTQLSLETKNKIYLAYGADDKFITANTLLANYLPEDQVVVQAGKHNWKTWGKLWPRLLEKL